MIGYVSDMLGADRKFVDSIKFRALVGYPATLFAFFPLSLLRDMSAFATGGLLSLIALFYTAVVMLIETPFYYKQNIDGTNPYAKDIQIFAFYFDWNFFSSAAITFFAYTCHAQLMPIYSELV